MKKITIVDSSKDVQCEHEWHYDANGWVEGCVPAICLKCKCKGCAHDVGDRLWTDPIFKSQFFGGI